MRSLKKLFAKPCSITKQNLVSKILVSVIVIMFASFTAFSQIRRINVNRFILKPDTTVKVQSIKNGRITATESAASGNIEVTENKKTVVPFNQKRILTNDTASYLKFKSISRLPYAQADVKIIPELHIEAKDEAGQDIFYKIIFTSLQPLRYNDTSKKFNARIGFFLIPESGSGNIKISEPVNIEVASNDISTIDPRELKISHLNMPSSNVDLIAAQVRDSAMVKVITTSNPEGYITYLKVMPTLKIFTNRTTLQGFGVQKIPVEVQFVGSDSPDSMKVDFSPGKGMVKPASIYVSYNKPSTVYLYSEGIGNTKLSAISNNIYSNDLYFKYVFPWYFLLASILGGLIGGLARYYFNQKKKKFPVRPIVGGILIGFIGAIAYYFLGMKPFKFDVSAEFNEIAVLAISAVGAYFGIGIKKSSEPA